MKVNTLLIIVSLIVLNYSHAESLFSDESYIGLVKDNRAFKKGDLITVLVYENSNSSTAAGADTNTGIDISGGAINDARIYRRNVNFSNDFEGGGRFNRSGKLVSRISATIESITANGEMWLYGEQIIDFNGEEQFISVMGRARPVDITSQNTILSSRLADSVIKFTGKGILNTSQKPGWITRIINFIF